MYTKNLNIRDFMASIPVTNRIMDFLKEGITTQNPIMAVSAMDELIRRGDVMYILDILEDYPWMTTNVAFAHILATSLADADNRSAPALVAYGKTLIRNNWSTPGIWAKHMVQSTGRKSTATYRQIGEWLDHRANLKTDAEHLPD